MSAQEIINDVIRESGRDDLEDQPEVLLGWMNRYKIYLQRDKRISFSENTTTIIAKANIRSTTLPSDFLFPIVFRRPKSGQQGITKDILGNQFSILKETVLHRWINREDFLDRFPIQREGGEPYTGTFNDFILQGSNVIWGPIPLENETIYVDYYRLLPKYTLNNLSDDFTSYFYDGLFYRCMEMVFTSWIPEEKKKEFWRSERIDAEVGIRKYQISREHPMESTLNMPDN